MSTSGKNGAGEQAVDGHHYEHPSEVPGHIKKCIHLIRAEYKTWF